MVIDKLYNINLFHWKPIPVKKVKWQPYLIYTKKNVFLARKPRLKKIMDDENPFLLPISNYNLKRELKRQSIDYILNNQLSKPQSYLFWTKPSPYSIKKPNYYRNWLWFNDHYFEKFNTPPLETKKFILRHVKGILPPNYYRKLDFILKNKKPLKIKLIREHDDRYLRLVNRPQSYQLWTKNRWLYTNKYLFKFETNEPFLHEDYLLALINAKIYHWRPRVFPIRKRGRIRFSHTFYQRHNFHTEVNIQSILSRNRNYFLPILRLLIEKPEKISLKDRYHWKTQELMTSLFVIMPEPYWATLRHWITEQNLDLRKKSQLSSDVALSKARFIHRNYNGQPLHKKRTYKEVEVFKTKFPYEF